MSSRVRTHYETLGIQPDAPDAVIRAAYKALSQLHHPDRHPEGQRADANARMSEINAAYDVLRYPESRARYDDELTRQSHDAGFSDEAEDASFGAAVDELTETWELARQVYPEIEQVRSRLKRISNDLAFGYSLVMLETKQFDFASDIGQRMERTFMAQHFGSNEVILEFALKLVLAGERPAALSLNKLVSVVGNANPQRIIDAVEKQHGVLQRLKDIDLRTAREQEIQAAQTRLKKEVLNHRSFDACTGWLRLHGYEVVEFGGSFFMPSKVRVTKTDVEHVFETASTFIRWTIDSISAGHFDAQAARG
ncbi:J domain-containing protein [Roseateles sp. So40a]|uniref:J domain-containing protein n=1 Tax=Roseateles sp. So40a TaxID=3400226 RepID=UPI003A865120